jgi:hypothetical protein
MTEPTKAEIGSFKEPYHEEWSAGALRLFHDDSGRLRLTVGDDRCYLDVKVARAFPMSDPDGYVALLDGVNRDMVIGPLVRLAELDDASRQAALESLGRRYCIPTIKRIVDLTEEFGAVYCDVLTDRGPRQFVVRGAHDAFEEEGESGLIIPDVDGNRYRVEDLDRLDARSRRLLEGLV